MTEAALLAAIAAAGDDMAPRLVYADWLLSNGDERGELITIDDAERRGRFERFVDDTALYRLMELAARHGFPRFPLDPDDALDPTAYAMHVDNRYSIHITNRATSTSTRFPNEVEAGIVRGPYATFECEVMAHIASRAARLGRAFDTIDVPYREAIAELHRLGPRPGNDPMFGVVDYERWCGLWKRWFRRP